MSFTFNTVANSESHAYTFHDVKNPIVQSVGLSWSQRIISMARFGNPNPSPMDLPHWPQYEPENRSCFLVDDVASVVHDADSKHALLW